MQMPLAALQARAAVEQEFTFTWSLCQTCPVVLVVKNPPAKAGVSGDAGLIPGLGRSPGGEHGNPLQYRCLGNPMDRGAWQATVHGVAESRTRLSDREHTFLRARVISHASLLFNY